MTSATDPAVIKQQQLLLADLRRQLQSAVGLKDQHEGTITELQTQLFTLKHAFAMLQQELKDERKRNGHPERGVDNSILLRGQAAGPRQVQGAAVSASQHWAGSPMKGSSPQPTAPTPSKQEQIQHHNGKTQNVTSSPAAVLPAAFALSYRSDRNNALLSKVHDQGGAQSLPQQRCVSYYIAQDPTSSSSSLTAAVAAFTSDVRPVADVDRRMVVKGEDRAAPHITASNPRITGDLRQRQNPRTNSPSSASFN